MRDLLYRESLSGTVGTILTTIFFLFFTGLIIWVYRRSRRSLYERISMMPLTDGDSTINPDLTE